MLCNPHNPVGRVWQKAELAQLVAIARKYRTLIISDEVHADIIFAGNEFTSIIEYGYEQSISIIGSPAKNFGLNSISNGYIYSDNLELKQQINSTVSSMSLDHGNVLTTYSSINPDNAYADHPTVAITASVRIITINNLGLNSMASQLKGKRTSPKTLSVDKYFTLFHAA